MKTKLIAKLTGASALAAVLGLALGAGSAAAAECPIVIGGLAPLSAPGSVTGGEAMRDAMHIAVDEINAKGGLLGCKVELAVGDTQGLPEQGTAVMENLINKEHAVAVGGGYHSSVGLAVEKVAQANDIPVVFAETWNDQITANEIPQAFRIAPLSSEVSAIFAHFAAIVPDVKKVVIVTENTDYGIPAAQEVKKGLDAQHIASMTFSVDIGTQDYAGIIQRVKAENPDMIIVLLTGEASYNFTQQAADAGIGPEDIPFTCDQVALESKGFWTNVPDGNDCFIARVGLPKEKYNDVTKSFLARYIKRTGKKAAESYAFEAYDSIMVLAKAIEDAKSTKGADIIKALEHVTYQGALGTITFPYGVSNPPEKSGKEAKWWHQWPNPAITVVQYQKKGQDSNDAPVVFPAQYKTGDPVFVNQ